MKMTEKTLPFTKEQIEELTREYPTPFYIYDEIGIRNTARQLYNAFSWVPDFKNYFAVKALPNPEILRLLKEEGMGADCSSLPELILSEMAGITGENIMFTSNDTPGEEFRKARDLGVIINLDDITHIDFLEKEAGMPEILCFRYNPGPLREGNKIIGNPVEAKYGLTTEQIFEAYRIARDKGVKRFGLHTMIVSNMLDVNYLIETGRMLFDLVEKISDKIGIEFEFVNLGGGIGIPYKLEDKAVDLQEFSEGVRKAYGEREKKNQLNIVMESGRAITGPHGYLISRVRHVARKYRDYIGLDACMANLMRPALYGAYHHITAIGKEGWPLDHVYDVTGSLCENNDKFAIQRNLPKIKPGDLLAIHDAGAHGHAMGFQYNGKLRSAEFLFDGNFRMIRRAETMKDYFAALNF